MKTSIASLATLIVAVGLVPGQARADHLRLSNIDRLASLLRQQAAQVSHEVRFDFAGAPNHRNLYVATVELSQRADYVEELVRRRAPLPQIDSAVRGLDRLFVEVRIQFREVERRLLPAGTGYHRAHRGFHHVGLRPATAVSPHRLRRLSVRIDELGETIHALGEVVYASARPVRGPAIVPSPPPHALPVRPPVYRPVAPVVPVFPALGSAIHIGKPNGSSFTLVLSK